MRARSRSWSSLLPVAALADIVGYRHVYRVGLAAVLAGLARLRAGALAALADRGAHLPGPGRRGASWRSSPRWCARSIRATMLGRGLGFNTTVVATSLAAGPSLGAALLSIASWPILFAVYVPLGIVSFVLCRALPAAHHARPPAVRRPVGGAVGRHLRAADLRHRRHGARPSAAGDRLPSSARAVVLGTLFVLAPDAARRSDDAGRHLQAADLRALDLAPRPAPSPPRAWPSSACPSSSTPCWASSATDTGILLTAWPLALAAIAPIAGRLADRHHAGLLGAIGLTSMTAGLVLTALLPRRPVDRRHHVAAGAVRRGLRHLRRAQQPADDERRAARAQRQRRRHHRHRPHPGPDRWAPPWWR
mgnify:CR=1 FL=1